MLKYDFVICIDNKDNEASLERFKVYRALKDDHAKNHSLLRVIDESGEDYLFPSNHFVPISLPQAVQDAMMLENLSI